MDEYALYRLLDKTDLIEHLNSIRELYKKLEADQKRFTKAFHISCVDGCGKCCESFNPDITENEAEFLAFGLIAEGIDDEVCNYLEKCPKNARSCPLYNGNSEYHCTVYRWRPLICRLFAFSASVDKNGKPTYRHCKWNLNGHDLTEEEINAHREDVILMRDYGLMLDESEINDTKTYMLADILPKAINKIRFIMQLEEEAKNL